MTDDDRTSTGGVESICIPPFEEINRLEPDVPLPNVDLTCFAQTWPFPPGTGLGMGKACFATIESQRVRYTAVQSMAPFG